MPSNELTPAQIAAVRAIVREMVPEIDMLLLELKRNRYLPEYWAEWRRGLNEIGRAIRLSQEDRSDSAT